MRNLEWALEDAEDDYDQSKKEENKKMLSYFKEVF